VQIETLMLIQSYAEYYTAFALFIDILHPRHFPYTCCSIAYYDGNLFFPGFGTDTVALTSDEVIRLSVQFLSAERLRI